MQTINPCQPTWEQCIPHITNFTHAIDIGARYAQFTSLILEKFQHCYSFDYRQTSIMERYVKQENRCTFYNYGLHDKEEQLTAWGGVIVESRSDHVSKLKRKVANLRTLDSFKFDNIGFIKIDVEGHELKVLKGAVETLKKYSPTLCIEQNDATEKWGKGKKFEALEFCKTLGYRVVDQQKHDYILVK